MSLLRDLAALVAGLIVFCAVVTAARASDDLHCIARAVYHEARGEDFTGQLAVAHVVLNRVDDPRFPRTACRVVAQPRAFPWYARRPAQRDRQAYLAALFVARVALEDRDGDPTRGAICFDQRHRRPPCRYETAADIGNHRFYTLALR